MLSEKFRQSSINCASNILIACLALRYENSRDAFLSSLDRVVPDNESEMKKAVILMYDGNNDAFHSKIDEIVEGILR